MNKKTLPPVKFVNLTPHTVTVFHNSGEKLGEFLPSGQVARVSVTKELVGEINGIPIYNAVKGEVIGFPEEEENTVYIVSAMVREAIYGKPHVVSPGDLVRNKEGQPIGCLGFYQ